MRYEVNVSRLENPSGNIRGFVNLVFNRCFKVNNITVVEGKEGNTFISMLRYVTSKGDEDYKDVCNPITKEFREELYDAIMEAYELAKEEKEKEPISEKPEKKGKAKGKDGQWMDVSLGDTAFR